MKGAYIFVGKDHPDIPYGARVIIPNQLPRNQAVEARYERLITPVKIFQLRKSK